jgi:hypothetical protein
MKLILAWLSYAPWKTKFSVHSFPRIELRQYCPVFNYDAVSPSFRVLHNSIFNGSKLSWNRCVPPLGVEVSGLLHFLY